VLNYRSDMSAVILRGFGANISDHNVRLLSSITLHRGDLETDFSNLTIGDNVVLNDNSYLDVSAPIILEKSVSLGPEAIIMSHNWYNGNKFLQERLSHTCGYQDVLIKEGAGIVAGAGIVMGVTIGRNAVIGARPLLTGTSRTIASWLASQRR
jgi:acetyltransferase-like isoleucine patch superfamily enzyme